MVNTMTYTFRIIYKYAGAYGNTREIMSWTDTSTLQSVYTEIAYCNTEMSKVFQEMYELNENKKPLDLRLRACERAVERYRLQLKGACEAKERMYLH